MTVASVPTPVSSRTLIGTRVASGATPTTPKSLRMAAAVPATWVPCPWPSSGNPRAHAIQATGDVDVQVWMIEIDARVEDPDRHPGALESGFLRVWRGWVECVDAPDPKGQRLNSREPPIGDDADDIGISRERLSCGSRSPESEAAQGIPIDVVDMSARIGCQLLAKPTGVAARQNRDNPSVRDECRQTAESLCWRWPANLRDTSPSSALGPRRHAVDTWALFARAKGAQCAPATSTGQWSPGSTARWSRTPAAAGRWA